MKKKKIFIYEVLTCNRRKLDAQRLKKYFIMNNYQYVQNPKDADIILLSTCAYSTKHAQTSLEFTKKFLTYSAELIVTGCLPEVEKEELQKIFNGKIISTKNLNQIDKFFSEIEVKFDEVKDANIIWENSNQFIPFNAFKKVIEKSKLANKMVNRTTDNIVKNLLKNKSSDLHHNIIFHPYYKYIKERFSQNLTFNKETFFIRPSWGCLGNCSYCVIKKAIGPLKSKPLATIKDEFKKGLDQGYDNFIFDADDLGAYGVDIGSNFSKMLDKITNISGEYKIHIRYVHPRWIVKHISSFKKVLKKEKIQCIGCSIQSGNPRILKLMHRYSNIEKIKNAFSEMYDASSDIVITTECINGFPTETKKEFKDTLNIISEINFDWGYIYPFSLRPGTKAECIEPKVSDQEILNRMKYAKDYLIKRDYDSSMFKKLNILAFSKSTPNIKINEDVISFCSSTID